MQRGQPPGAHTADQEFLGWLSSSGVEGGRLNQRCAKLLLSWSCPSALSQSPGSSAQLCLYPTSMRTLALGVSHSRVGSRDPHHSSARDPSPPLQDCSVKDITVASGPSTKPLCGVLRRGGTSVCTLQALAPAHSTCGSRGPGPPALSQPAPNCLTTTLSGPGERGAQGGDRNSDAQGRGAGATCSRMRAEPGRRCGA